MALYESLVDGESVPHRRCDVKSGRDVHWLSAIVTHTVCLLMRCSVQWGGLALSSSSQLQITQPAGQPVSDDSQLQVVIYCMFLIIRQQ